jgi:F-type H+-transporting ATPase subunit delta
MSVETIARRYASALADVVIKSGETETVKAELKTWDDLINSNINLQKVFSNPAIAHLSKEKVLEDLLAKTKPSRTTANFLRVLLRNSRLANLSEINQTFLKVLEERSGIAAGQVISARPLSESEKSALQAEFAKLTGKQVFFNYQVNENIIGGVITRVGSTIYDNSVRTKLENLRQKLMER